MSREDVNNDSYVGDYFTLSFIRSEAETLRYLEGQRGKLIGFKSAIKSILPHQVTAFTPYTGFYQTIGDPVLRLDMGNIVQVPIINLVPEGYRFTDRLLKNQKYREEVRRYKYLCELPPIPYNIGDKVLVAGYGTSPEDFVSEILDISFRGNTVFYLFSPKDEIIATPSSRVIDVIEHGELSELERLGKLHQCYESLAKKRISRFKYSDDENTLPLERG